MVSDLTRREREVLGWYAEGYNPKQIALKMNITAHTLRNHLYLIGIKMGVSGAVNILTEAARLGIIDLEEQMSRHNKKTNDAAPPEPDGVSFSEREMQLMLNCITYASASPAGLPGHNLMLIIAKLVNALGVNANDIRGALDQMAKQRDGADNETGVEQRVIWSRGGLPKND